VGSGKLLDDGSLRKLDVKAGDKILFAKYSGSDIKMDGVEHMILARGRTSSASLSRQEGNHHGSQRNHILPARPSGIARGSTFSHTVKATLGHADATSSSRSRGARPP